MMDRQANKNYTSSCIVYLLGILHARKVANNAKCTQLVPICVLEHYTF